MTDHIWKMHASNCLVAVEVRSQLSSQMGKGQGRLKKKILRYFHILVWHLLIFCSKKACGLSWKICQQYNISPSSALLSLPVVIWIMFPSHGDIKNQKKSATLIAWAQSSHNKDSKALQLWPSSLIPCSRRSQGKYISTSSRHEAPCQIYSSKNSSKSKMTPWVAARDHERASISKSSKISLWQIADAPLHTETVKSSTL